MSPSTSVAATPIDWSANFFYFDQCFQLLWWYADARCHLFKLAISETWIISRVVLPKDCFSLDILLVPKISKRHFFRDIQNSFHEVTHLGLEPHQIFSFWNISTNMVARGVQSFGRNGPWWAGCLKYGQNFFLKFTQTCDEQMLKISRRYLDSCLI